MYIYWHSLGFAQFLLIIAMAVILYLDNGNPPINFNNCSGDGSSVPECDAGGDPTPG